LKFWTNLVFPFLKYIDSLLLINKHFKHVL